MNNPFTNSQKTFGFISVREIEGLGHCGGLLIVSQIGRPIEFHCSAPVPTNRAQKILYGRTYDTFLYCEQIGLALIDKAKTKPNLFIANCGPLLSLNSIIEESVVVLKSDDCTELPPLHESESTWKHETIEVHQRTIWACGGPENIQRLKTIRSLMESFTKSLPLEEPFERIQKAIDEAQAVSK